MDFVALLILAMGAFLIAFVCLINWLEARDKKKNATR
jgi:hypothetical protein